MTVIAMAREMATRGSEIAAGIAEKLGLNVVHHEIVEHDIAERTGLPESAVHRFLEGEASMWERWKIDHKRMSRYTAQEILELACKGNVIIRGWGATYLLKSIPHVICIRTCAPMSYREDVLMKRLALDDRAMARREVQRNDTAHNGTMQRLFNIDWQDPSLYAAVYNTERVPVADCIDQIIALSRCEAFKQTPHSMEMLNDQLILARVNDALESKFGMMPHNYGLDAEVKAGQVTLTGATTDSGLIANAVRVVQNVPGVKHVESKVNHIEFVPHAVG